MKKIILCLSATLFVLASCRESANDKADTTPSDILIECNQNLTDAQVERHFTPPVAARNYAYPNIAAYSVLQPFHQEYLSLNGQLKDLQLTSQPEENQEYNQELMAFNAFSLVALRLVYGDTIVSNFREHKLKTYKYQITPDVFKRSMDYSQAVADEILAWADKDMYKETRNYAEFMVAVPESNWKPTSPDYMPAIEPHWNQIRPFVMDSASQFEPDRPTAFDMADSALFYKETIEVLETVKTITDEQEAIAQFWDCNPNISHHHGHFMYFLQKISPGGHWVHIGLQVLDEQEQTLIEGATTMSLLTMTLHDAFIACWTEKYYSNYVRPETVIKENIDKNWEPVLQTPAFPEYPSGHSVASASAATVLSAHISDSYTFTDSTEVPYGLPARSFNSFREASDEAAISRLYGGIHFMPAIENGVDMGNRVGELVLSRITFKKAENE